MNQYSSIYNLAKRMGNTYEDGILYIDLENLLKKRGISKNKVCENCGLQRT